LICSPEKGGRQKDPGLDAGEQPCPRRRILGPHTKKDAYHARFEVPVEANGKTPLRHSLLARW